MFVQLLMCMQIHDYRYLAIINNHATLHFCLYKMISYAVKFELATCLCWIPQPMSAFSILLPPPSLSLPVSLFRIIFLFPSLSLLRPLLSSLSSLSSFPLSLSPYFTSLTSTSIVLLLRVLGYRNKMYPLFLIVHLFPGHSK